MTAPFMLPQPLGIPPKQLVNSDPFSANNMSAGVGSFIQGLHQMQKDKLDEALRQQAAQTAAQAANTNEGYRRAQERRLDEQSRLGQETIDAKTQAKALADQLRQEQDQHLLDQLKVARPDLADAYSQLKPGVDSPTIASLRPALFGQQGTPVVDQTGKVLFLPNRMPVGSGAGSTTPTPAGPQRVTAAPTNVQKTPPGGASMVGSFTIPNVIHSLAEANDIERGNPTALLGNTAFGGYGPIAAGLAGRLAGPAAEGTLNTKMESGTQRQGEGIKATLVHNLVGLMPHSRSSERLLAWINSSYFPLPGTPPTDRATIQHFAQERQKLALILSQLPNTATEADIARAIGVPVEAAPVDTAAGGPPAYDPFVAYRAGGR